MVDRQKIVAAVKTGSRRGLKAGALLMGMSIIASCSMFGEDSSDVADDPAAAARAVGEVERGLVGDSGNARYDESIRRRPVTTVRPLEDAPPAPAPAAEPAPQAAAPAPVDAAPVAAAPVESAPVETAAAAPAVPAPAPVEPVAAAPTAAPAPAPQPVVTARPSGTSPVIAESKPAPLVATAAPAEAVERSDLEPGPADAPGAVTAAVAAAPAVVAAPVPAPEPLVSVQPAQPQLLVADTSRLDAAVAQAYGGRAAPRPVALNPAAMTGAVGVAAGGGYGAGPVVIGGGRAQPAMQPAVMSQGGTVVVGGIQPAVVIGGHGGGGGSSAVALPSGDPVAVIHFEFGSRALDARDRQVIRQVADLQARQGGFIKVVGHSSRFTADMPQQRHMLVNFETSVARADAVAAALVREGVPSEVVEVAALGASEPRYQEVMPSGQVGNQRVEIFLIR